MDNLIYIKQENELNIISYLDIDENLTQLKYLNFTN
jgi:hypothetical protein